jgi:hypothetical protein
MIEDMKITPANTCHGLKPFEFGELQGYIFNNQEGLKRTAIIGLLENFGRYHDLHAMYCYFKKAQDRGLPASEIMRTLMHDLNGVHDPYFTPITGSY